MTHRMKNWVSAFAVAGLSMAGTAVAQQGQQPPAQQDQAQQQKTQKTQKTGQKQQKLTGKIASTEGGQIYLETKQGAVVPFAVGGDTQYKGKLDQGETLTSAEQLQAGDEVQVSFTASGEENQASEIQLKKGQKAQELGGKVASASGNEILIEHQGAMIPVKVNEQTKFSGKTAQGETLQSADQIEQGAQVRASFKVQNETENVASSIELQKQGTKQQKRKQMAE